MDKFDNVLLDLLKSRYDSNKTTNESYAAQLVAVHKEFATRNAELTTLLKDYITQRRVRVTQNTQYKKWMYIIFVGLFVALTVAVIFVFCRTDIDNANIEGIVSLVTVAATYLSSVLSIMKIMSKYLFPVDEEKDTIEMIKAVIKNDIEVEKIMSDAIDKAKNIDAEKLRECKALFDENILTQNEFDRLKADILNKVKDD